MHSKLVITHYHENILANTPRSHGEIKKETPSPSLKIAFLSDVHEQKPTLLLKNLKKLHPDLILIAGDTLERNEDGHGVTLEMIDSYQIISPNWSRFCRCLKTFHKILERFHIKAKSKAGYGSYFLEEVSKIAPVYMSIGNHEWYFLPEDYALFRKCGIHLLDNQDCKISIQGNTFHIGGLSTMHNLNWLKEYSEKEGYKILLCHHPEYYPRFILENGNSFDLVLSGHVHGGQWRFFGRGILAPGQGPLPIYHHGRYSKMIVNAGSCNPSFLPRFGNPCEIVMIHLG